MHDYEHRKEIIKKCEEDWEAIDGYSDSSATLLYFRGVYDALYPERLERAKKLREELV